ncbi:hypothetical protein AJ81_06940 [Pseudothermotoga hypogea DSM 11164 = NBRC 106472]|uniref:Tail specific protease domain-containing protein n=1 Tax=Pseudothermotoga hypogea DSM 11164 = NBRC 106472 TaxID=1123384 RepID=A0A0X1KU30_9THEM|nr:S41 family peptidase [Pseudothermotoga hypogea]AJC74810.1 hypothetical protein AJ81_06940 [Pseudothermotoga hypogea DSM 11164 = NBRC 106472]MBC7122119.1 S41 family peptidase [Pseudothermotoga sp.]
MRSVVFLFFLIGSCAIAQMFSAAEVLQDAEFVYQKLKDVHVNIFHTFSEIEAEEEFSKLKSRLSAQQYLGLREAFKLLSEFVALFKDGHTYLSITDQFYEYLDADGKIVPILVSFTDEGIIILADVEGKINEPCLLMSLNGIPAEELKDEILRMISYEKVSFAYVKASKLFHQYCWVIFKEPESFGVEYSTKQGVQHKIELAPVSFEEYKSRRDQLNLSNEKLWDFSTAGKNTAILRIDTFGSYYEKDLKQFIKEAFERVKREGIQNLIIDLRENGGGDSRIAEYLYSFISDKPYRIYAEVHVKYSDDAIRKLKIFDPLLLFRIKVLKQETIVYRNSLKKPKKNDLLFNGNIFVLTGSQTFSAATDFAAMTKDLMIATIVGEETGGLASSYGDVLPLTLPNTGLRLGVSFKYFVRCGGFDDKRGVIPDVVIRADPHSVLQGVDQAVQTVLEIVRSDDRAKERR